ncbi:MAG: HAD family phosphatase [Paraprevotella sp.]|nr:HAD family phosphatase [Paraprevotella sp.]MDD5856148.1 HAD family phosphatase [Prevotella sp.]
MIRNIVFDLGGVIMTICQEEAIKRFKSIGLKNVEDYLNPYTQTDIFGDIEEGKISAEQFRAKLSELIGKEVTYEECKFAWLGYRQDVPLRNLDILRKLKAQGYKLILLSNTNPFMMSWGLSGEFDGNGNSLESYFDSLYLSYKLGVMKPNKKIFQYIIDNEKIQPGESLFIDDGERNINAARLLGFKTLCPINGEDWTKELIELLKNNN